MNKEQLEALCTNCGLCCYVHGLPCRHLGYHPDGKSFCKIYKTRLGTVIRAGYKCNNVMDIPNTWPDCPYNELKKDVEYKRIS